MRRLPSRLQRRDQKSVVGVCAIAGGFPAGGGLQNGLPFLDRTRRERLDAARIGSCKGIEMNIREYQECPFILRDGETCGIGDLESLELPGGSKARIRTKARRGMRTDKSIDGKTLRAHINYK